MSSDQPTKTRKKYQPLIPEPRRKEPIGMTRKKNEKVGTYLWGDEETLKGKFLLNGKERKVIVETWEE